MKSLVGYDDAQQIIGREAKQRLCYERRLFNFTLSLAVSPTSIQSLGVSWFLLALR